MSGIIKQAVTALSEKLGSGSFDGSAKFSIEGEGGVIIDAQGVRSGDDKTDVTLIADAETFQEILSGDLDPTSAFMGGRLRVEGDMSTAMRLSGLF
ncbi:MAG: SCP2 sterol-binding domain-containing protein [Paracoccaceae bacterium]|jgi:putative sterol carrier protein|nr:SCP2 sterol-binding domain-containing protein [Paracoccaceae bacterium]